MVTHLQPLEATVVVDMKHARELLDMCLGPIALAIRRDHTDRSLAERINPRLLFACVHSAILSRPRLKSEHRTIARSPSAVKLRRRVCAPMSEDQLLAPLVTMFSTSGSLALSLALAPTVGQTLG